MEQDSTTSAVSSPSSSSSPLPFLLPSVPSNPIHRDARNNPPRGPLDRLQSACLDLCLALLDQQLVTDDYDCALVWALGILGVTKDGWSDYFEYSSFLSGFLKTSRFLVIQASIRDHLGRPLLADLSVYWERFMVLGSGSPMEWAITLRSWGMSLARDHTSIGTIDWIKDRLIYGRYEFSMTAFRNFVSQVLYKARDLLFHSLLFSIPLDRLPRLDLCSLRDDAGIIQPGWSFIQDPRNGLEDLHSWLVHWIRREGPMGLEDFFHPRGHGGCGMPEMVREYCTAVDHFRSTLVVLIHITGGMPARGPELLSIRFENTADGGTRNIFIGQQMVEIVTFYHKSQNLTGKPKAVHRFLPHAVGVLLVRYLTLIQPFWESLCLYYHPEGRSSAFLWAKPASEEYWDSEKLRRALQLESMMALGEDQVLDIRHYRHIAVAMAKKFLPPGRQFPFESDHPGSDDDDILDRQAAHSS